MSPGTKLGDHIDEFNKLILDLANSDIEIEDEDEALMLLTSLPSSYENFMETLLYGRESLAMEDVLSTLNLRELKKKTEGVKEETNDVLYVRGRSDHSDVHLKRDCPMKKSSEPVRKVKHDQDSDAYFGEELVVVENDEMTELVMDSGDNKTCTIKETNKVKYIYMMDQALYWKMSDAWNQGDQRLSGYDDWDEEKELFKKLGHKQVRFKQLGPGVETKFHGVQVDKRVWFEMKDKQLDGKDKHRLLGKGAGKEARLRQMHYPIASERHPDALRSRDACMESILERYERYSYTERQLVATDATPRSWTLEYNKLKSRAELLQRNHRHYMGEDIESLSLKEIQNLEQQLDTGLKNIRARKNQLLHESISELQKKGKAIQEQNTTLTKKIKEKEKDKTITENVQWEQHNYVDHDTTFLMPQPSPGLNMGGNYNQGGGGAGEGADGRTNELDLSLQYSCHMSEHPSPPPTLTLVEKLYAVHNINSLIPEKLDLAESNYSTWSYFFKGHCSNFGALKHIEEPVTEASTSTPPTDKWITVDSIIETILTLLTDLGSDMSNDDVVTYAINGLSDKYGSLAQIIAHKDPFPDLATVRSMVATEELRLRSRSSVLPTGTTSSAPQVLLAEASSRMIDNQRMDNRCLSFPHDFLSFLRYSRNSNNSNNSCTTQWTLPMQCWISICVNVSQLTSALQNSLPAQTNQDGPHLVQNGLSGQSRPQLHRLPVWSTVGPTSPSPTTEGTLIRGYLYKLDVKNAFYMVHIRDCLHAQPPGYGIHNILISFVIYKAISIWALSKPPRAWFHRFCQHMLATSAFSSSIKTTLHAEFSMTDLGPLNYFLGISETRNTSGMFLSQQNLAGALQYLTFTWPDISYAVQQVCLYMHDPREPHFSALKRILRIGLCPLHVDPKNPIRILCFSWQQSTFCGLQKRQVTLSSNPMLN
ncbi:APETALA1 like protein [Tanacetum coccineum]